LEAAKILSQYRFNSTIKFAAWTTEELGLIGSEHWVKNAAKENMNIGAYLNFDMIGYDPGNNMGLDIGYNDDSIWISDEMVNINNDFSIGLTITTGQGGTRSDHASFWQWGYPAVECIESDFNTPNYHTVNDTVDKLNMLFDKKVTQLGLATLAKLAGVLPPSLGAIYLDKIAYKTTDSVSITLYDTDMNVNGGLIEWFDIEISSTTESTPEMVTLVETGVNTSIFTGAINLNTGAPSTDGVLQVDEGDTINAEYQDFSPFGLRSASAKVDNTPPQISNVQVTAGVSKATITWDTNEESDSKIYFGISPFLGTEVSDSKMVLSHSVELNGLKPSLKYYFDVQSADYAGNTAYDDNMGAHYNFTTLLGITSSAESGFIGYVKESDPSGNYFTGPDIIVGHGAQGNYHGAVHFYDLWFPSSALLTNATVEFFGKRWIYTGSGGTWDLHMLDSAIDSDWQNHGYTEIQNATIEDTISPTVNDDDLKSRIWNTFYYDPSQYLSLKNHLANTMISYRLDGPSSGRYIFVWETGNGDDSWGVAYAPRLTVTYDPIGDTQGPSISGLKLSPNPSAGVIQITLSGLLSDTLQGGSNIVTAEYYDPVLKSWIDMNPEDGFFNSPSENILGYVDISTWPDGNYTLWVRGLDDSGNWGDLNYIVLMKKPTYDIPLTFGWNFISLPMNQSTYSISSIFSSISGYYDAVQWYDTMDSSDPWKHNHILKSPSSNDLNEIDHTKGIWIHITKPQGVIFECSGTPNVVNIPISLKSGWNHVGYPSLINKSRTQGLNNLDFNTNLNAIWTYDSEQALWKEMGEFDEFEAGRAYWIHSKSDAIWLVPN
jgi:hypothetical protein